MRDLLFARSFGFKPSNFKTFQLLQRFHGLRIFYRFSISFFSSSLRLVALCVKCFPNFRLSSL
ncbi:MAG: hypothetical protein DMG39_00915 [Acidobacteria bacterium]|nr:MAG: hypothetical protein DMG39_00915 [Acidobacteriota bacterium]